MTIKKLTLILIFLAITGCGYEPIYSKKDTLNISINKIEFEGEKKINRKIISLADLKVNNNKQYSYTVNLNSKKISEIIAKDKSGNASIFRTTINVILTLKDPKDNNQITKKKSFSSSFTYNNIENKFDLLQYRGTIDENLINRIAEEIIIFLNS
tara:strand:- start:169 stop:633 length:465 start_codon:yes stop_codon:yes gene_type:complete